MHQRHVAQEQTLTVDMVQFHHHLLRWPHQLAIQVLGQALRMVQAVALLITRLMAQQQVDLVLGVLVLLLYQAMHQQELAEKVRQGLSLFMSTHNMSIYAVVKNGSVVNVIEWDGATDYNPGKGFELILADGEEVSIGYEWNGENFIRIDEIESEKEINLL